MQDGVDRNLKKWTLQSGYLDMRKVFYLPCPFIFVLGGRGTGKTYGALELIIEDGIGSECLYLRISDKEHDLLSDKEYSPFSWHNQNKGWNIYPFKKNKFFTDWYEAGMDEDGKLIPLLEKGRRLHSTSLNGLKSVRGFNGSWINYIIFDEFIKQKKSSIRMNDDDFKDVYETINRNREIEGHPPVKAVFFSNSVSVDNHVMRSYHIVDDAVKMKKNGQIFKMLPKRGIAIFILPETEIGKMKKETALYRACGVNDEYVKMALCNEFSYDRPTRIKSLNVKGMTQIFNYNDEICGYMIPGTRDYYISSYIKNKNVDMYKNTPTDIIQLRKYNSDVWDAYLDGGAVFETFTCEIMFRKLFLDRVWE